MQRGWLIKALSSYSCSEGRCNQRHLPLPPEPLMTPNVAHCIRRKRRGHDPEQAWCLSGGKDVRSPHPPQASAPTRLHILCSALIPTEIDLVYVGGTFRNTYWGGRLIHS